MSVAPSAAVPVLSKGAVFSNATQMTALVKSEFEKSKKRYFTPQHSGRSYCYRCSDANCTWSLKAHRSSSSEIGYVVSSFVGTHIELCTSVHKPSIKELANNVTLLNFARSHPNCTVIELRTRLRAYLNMDLDSLDYSKSSLHLLKKKLMKGATEEVLDEMDFAEDEISAKKKRR
jgi:hypothetical protein